MIFSSIASGLSKQEGVANCQLNTDPLTKIMIMHAFAFSDSNHAMIFLL